VAQCTSANEVFKLGSEKSGSYVFRSVNAVVAEAILNFERCDLITYLFTYLSCYLPADVLNGMCIQEILGGRYVAVEKYSAQFFQRFRSENIVELTVDFARVSRFICCLRYRLICSYG